MTKHEAIKAAYGEHWEKVKDYVDENGWCNAFFNIAGNHFKETESKKNKWRPSALTNLETNNDWNNINSANDLPKEIGTYWFINKKTGRLESRFYISTNKNDIISFRSNYSHWKRIDKPKPPIF